MVIRPLPKPVIEKIAAGEVIERPVSVVKELIENSLDAGATEIKVYVEAGGKRLIRVIDNGSGMSKEDLMMCARRYTTSKISKEDDLTNITTLGFRGEALASITAVADLTISSSSDDSGRGYRAIYDQHGNPTEVKPVGMSRGTDVVVRNLFSRFPARYKFLKGDDLEFSYILDLIKMYSLGEEKVTFKLYRDGREVFLSPKGSLLDKVYYVFGNEIAKNLLPVEADRPDLKVRGFISKIGYTRKTKDYQVVFVNDRLVRSKEVVDAVYAGYGNRLFLNRHPVIVLKIYISPDEIDVNVHPSKRVIKFKNEHTLTRIIRETISDSLTKYDLSVDVSPRDGLSRPVKVYPTRGEQTQLPLTPLPDIKRSDRLPVQKPLPVQNTTEETYRHPGFPRLRVVGQVNRTYILAENEEGLYIIDQHASQERVNYEKYLKQLSDSAIITQELLEPVILELNDTESRIVREHLSRLKRYGYTLEEYGVNMWRLLTIPAVFAEATPIHLFKDVLDELSESERTSIDERLDERIATKSCRASIKAGHEMTPKEMEDLLDQLSRCKNPFTCPHGRPTLIRIGWGEMEKKFNRKA